MISMQPCTQQQHAPVYPRVGELGGKGVNALLQHCNGPWGVALLHQLHSSIHLGMFGVGVNGREWVRGHVNEQGCVWARANVRDR